MGRIKYAVPGNPKYAVPFPERVFCVKEDLREFVWFSGWISWGWRVHSTLFAGVANCRGGSGRCVWCSGVRVGLLFVRAIVGRCGFCYEVSSVDLFLCDRASTHPFVESCGLVLASAFGHIVPDTYQICSTTHGRTGRSIIRKTPGCNSLVKGTPRAGLAPWDPPSSTADQHRHIVRLLAPVSWFRARLW